jgi:hypothetical protein
LIEWTIPDSLFFSSSAGRGFVNIFWGTDSFAGGCVLIVSEGGSRVSIFFLSGAAFGSAFVVPFSAKLANEQKFTIFT